jgi:hypothetical protein
MDDAQLVGAGECVRDLTGDEEGLVEGERSAVEAGGEGLSREELHGEEENFAGFTGGGVEESGFALDVEGTADVGMGDFEGEGDFSAEALEGFGV